MSNLLTSQNQFPNFLKKAFYNKAKYTVIPAGRQSGKTMNSVIWLITQVAATKEKKNGLWIDTRNANIAKYWVRYFKPILGNIWKVCKLNKQQNVLTFPNGNYIDFGSAEKPENLEGFSYNYVIINEAGICLKKPDLWEYTLQPMTKDGIVKFIGTPKGKNLFHKLYIRGLSKDFKQWESFKYTAFDSPFWETEQLENIKKSVPSDVFQQEYLGVFLDKSAGVFRKINLCLDKTIVPLDKGIPGKKYVMGVDLAKTIDFTVIIVIDVETKKVVYFDRFNKIDWGFQKKRIYDVHKKFNNATCMLDESGVGKPIFDDMKKVMKSKLRGYNITATNKSDLIESLILAIESQSLYYFNIPTLLNELEIYEYNTSRTGHVSYSAPEGFHDDAVIALALAWQLIKKPVNNFGFAIG